MRGGDVSILWPCKFEETQVDTDLNSKLRWPYRVGSITQYSSDLSNESITL